MVEGLGDAVGVENDLITPNQLHGGLHILNVIENPKRDRLRFIEHEHRTIGAAFEPGRVMPGAGVSKRQIARVVDRVEGSDEVAVGRVMGREPFVNIREQFAGLRNRARVGVRQGVHDRHQDRGRCAVPTDVGDQESPFAILEREDVVIIPARARRGLVVRRQIETGDLGQVLGQERALDVGDHLELRIDLLVREVPFAFEHEHVRGPPEEIGPPDRIGQLGRVEEVRVVQTHDEHVERLPVVVAWHRDDDAHARQVFVGRVVLGDIDLGQIGRLALHDEVHEQARFVDGQLVLVLPRIEVGLPFRGPRNLVARSVETPPTQGDIRLHGQVGAHPVAVELDHLLRIGLLGELPHEQRDLTQACLPVAMPG